MDEKRYSHVIATDTGGTFTDCIGVGEDGVRVRRKVLSKGVLVGRICEAVSPRVFRVDRDWGLTTDILAGYRFRLSDGPGFLSAVERFDPRRRLLTLVETPPQPVLGRFELSGGEEAAVLGARLLTNTPLLEPLPPAVLRVGTTRGTNALLERTGTPPVLITTEGFGDVLAIGTQARPDIFALEISTPRPLTATVVEVAERISASGEVLRPLDIEKVRAQLLPLRNRGVATAAAALVNAHRNPVHERQIAALLMEMGFAHVSVSSQLSKRMSYLARARTAVVNAYLSPVISAYIGRIQQAAANGRVFAMSSGGALMEGDAFEAKDSLLSGPAGGTVGMAAAGKRSGFSKLIGFDMGGTSTDVSRYDDGFDYRYTLKVGDGEIFTRALAVETVAAGGGSICRFDGYKLRVGPMSAGADPGPACYGAGGPLCIADIDLLAGKLDPALFGIPVDPALSEAALSRLLDEIEAAGAPRPSRAEAIAGFSAVADELMAGAVKTVSAAKGFDPSEYAMVAFGGAGGLHACSVSDILGIRTVVSPADGGLLSAAGILDAALERQAEAQLLMPLDDFSRVQGAWVEKLRREAFAALGVENEADAVFETRVFCRFDGQSTALPVDDLDDTLGAFKRVYTELFGHWHDRGVVEVESLRVTAREAVRGTPSLPVPAVRRAARPVRNTDAGVPVFERELLSPGDGVAGPALLLDPFSATYIAGGWRGATGEAATVVLTRSAQVTRPSRWSPQADLALFAARFMFIADTMGVVLRRTAASVNVKERLDFSAALLDAKGRLVANAHHIPVHLGALGTAVRRVLETHTLEAGDLLVTNHPAFGGSHLPDVTVIAPVFAGGRCIAHTAVRAHHAELGGKTPGSMPPDAATLTEEGVVIPPLFLRRKGVWRFDALDAVLRTAPYPSRAPEENMADIRAQAAAVLRGARDLAELAAREGEETVLRYFALLRENAAAETVRALGEQGERLTATEFLDDGTPLSVTVRRVSPGRWAIDWTGSGPVHPGNLNGTEAVAVSVVMYVLRLLIHRNVPLNDGLLEPIEHRLPESIVSPRFDADGDRCPAVSAGNTELSSRMTDTLLKALGIAAASQGTMNNLLLGNDDFGYYETIGGGTGAGPGWSGRSGVHSHMTNTRITDVEVMEHRYPVQVERFSLRPESGGRGVYSGGDGLIRALRVTAPLTLSFVSERRASGPYGASGGGDGLPGTQRVIRSDGTVEPLAGRGTTAFYPGDCVWVETPGGGGWGSPEGKREGGGASGETGRRTTWKR